MNVGNVQKGPIQALYERSSGKGLPEFCALAPEIVPWTDPQGKQSDKVVVKISLRNMHHEERGPTRLVIGDSPYLEMVS